MLANPCWTIGALTGVDDHMSLQYLDEDSFPERVRLLRLDRLETTVCLGSTILVVPAVLPGALPVYEDD